MCRSSVDIYDAGMLEYADALAAQEDLLQKRIKGEAADTLMVLEHEPVLTRGRLSREDSVFDGRYFSEKGIPVVNTSRGGDATCHLPGQLVLYPVIDLRSRGIRISGYIDLLERMVRDSLLETGVPAERISGRRGVWAGGKKIAFTGIAVKKWVTYHGVSVNINNDLTPFSHMHPCGEKDIRVTSVKEYLGREAEMDTIKGLFIKTFMAGLSEKAACGR